MAFTAVLLVLRRGKRKGLGAGRPWLVSLFVAALTHRLATGAWYVAGSATAGLIAATLWASRA